MHAAMIHAKRIVDSGHQSAAPGRRAQAEDGAANARYTRAIAALSAPTEECVIEGSRRREGGAGKGAALVAHRPFGALETVVGDRWEGLDVSCEELS